MKRALYYEKINDTRGKKYRLFDENLNQITATNEKPDGLQEVIKKDAVNAIFYNLKELKNGYCLILGREHYTGKQLETIADSVKPKKGAKIWRCTK